jgi:hypothetical protein
MVELESLRFGLLRQCFRTDVTGQAVRVYASEEVNIRQREDKRAKLISVTKLVQVYVKSYTVLTPSRNLRTMTS